MTALMDAVNGNQVAKVKKLVQQGADVNELDDHQDAPLVIAAYKGFVELLQLLLDAGADVRAVDPEMQATALHAAAYAGRTEAAQVLIRHGIDIDKQGPFNGYTALHDAVWQNHVATAQVLIDAGTNLHLKSNAGETPLDLARKTGSQEIVSLIERKLRQ